MKYTLVTGGSVGIGLALAHVAARNRRNVILTARSRDNLAAAADEIREAHGVDVITIPADLGVGGEAARLWAEATAEDRQINFLMNNAGLGSHGPFLTADWARERTSIDVNITALTELCKLAAPHMAGHGDGRILNVASVAGFIPGPSMAVYHATKAYVLSLSVALREEFSGTGVTVTARCPGATQSNFFSDAKMENVRFLKSGQIASAASVAELGYSAALTGRAVATPGLMNQSAAWMARILTRPLAAKIARNAFGTM